MRIEFKKCEGDVDVRMAQILIAKGYAKHIENKVDVLDIEISEPVKKQPGRPRKKMAFTLVDDNE